MSINASAYGTVGKDAEIKTVGQGNIVVKWSVAVNRKQGGQESTTWLNCSWFGKRAEKVAPMIHKGDRIVVHGDLYSREYNGKVSVDMDVNNVNLCSNRRDGSATSSAPAASGNGYDEATYGNATNSDPYPF